VAILESYRPRFEARQFPMLVIVNPENLGVRRNFEKALGLCAGEFIAPCDQDDIWLPAKLATLRRALGERALAYCDSAVVDAEGVPTDSRMSDNWRMQDVDDAAAFVMDNCVSGHALLLRRALLGQALPLQEGFFHDWWLAAVAAAGDGIAFSPEVLVHYRRHAATVTFLPGSAEAQRRRELQRRGAGLRRQLDIAARLAGMVRLPGPHREFCRRLQQLWLARDDQWLSLRLAALLCLNTRRLYRFKKLPLWKLRLKTLRYAVGLKFKKAAGRMRYAG
jgi:hypothetical protein